MFYYITVAKPTDSFVSPLTRRFAISVNIRRRKCKTVLSHNTLLAVELVVEFVTLHSYLPCIPEDNTSRSFNLFLVATNRAFVYNSQTQCFDTSCLVPPSGVIETLQQEVFYYNHLVSRHRHDDGGYFRTAKKPLNFS